MRRLIPGLVLACSSLLLFTSTAFSQSTVTWNSVRLTWTAVGDDSLTGTATTYDIRYSLSPITVANFASAAPVTGEPVPATPGTRQYHTVTGLQPSTTYYFAIKTADEAPNWSLLSNVISRTTLAAPDTIRPAPIANLTVTAATGNSASLAWTAVGDDSLTGTATSYDVRYSTSAITAANWNTATQASGEPSPAAAGTPQNFTVTGLAQQTTYYFAVKATDDAGNVGALSNVPSGITLDTIAPAAVTDLAVGWIWLGGMGGSAVDPRAPIAHVSRSGWARR